MTGLLAASTVVRLETDEGVAVVTVDNPPVNLLTNGVLAALGDVSERIDASLEIRSVVLTGTGTKAFLAGADLEEFRAALGTTHWIEEHTELTRRVFGLWERLPQPVVAAVQASAMGGGLEMALVCDLIVADPRAYFGLPEVSLGLIPGAGGTQRLPRKIGAGAASEMLLLGSPIDAARAASIGLVSRVSAPDAALVEAKSLAKSLAALPSSAVQSAKRAMWRPGGDIDDGFELERELFLGVFASDDAREGVAAFLERRPPLFRHGRIRRP